MNTILKDPVFILLKTNQLYSLECSNCKNLFQRLKKHILHALKNNLKMVCSKKCFHNSQNLSSTVNCSHCDTKIKKPQAEIKKNKSGNFFCNQSCAASFNNTHKKFGNRKSKLEIWLESKLSIQYPELKILYASKEAINSELDIYIPSLNLAFELNGIYHYEPIHGQDKLDKIQNNDHRKFQACLEKGIELCIIDTSQHKYVKEQTNLKYLEIIKKIIDRKLNLVTE